MALPVVPPIAIPSVSVRMISNLSCCWSGSSRYSVPASALVMRLAATRMVSSRRLISRSLESATPMAFSSSSRCSRLSPSVMPAPCSAVECALLDTNGAYLMNIGNTTQHFFDTVLFQGAHTFLQRGREQLGNARMFLNKFFHRVGADHQLV